MFIADFHVHSRFAMGCSKKLTPENMWKTAVLKGINLIGTGDFTHPEWLDELKIYLQEDGKGFLQPKDEYLKKWISDLKNSNMDGVFVYDISQNVIENLENGNIPKFVLQTEINNIFARNSKKHRIHNCILVENFFQADEILNYFSQFGKIDSDGRLGLHQDQKDTLLWLKKNFSSVIFFPAHIWTPYFGVLGSRFGFNSLSSAFLESYFLIDGVETGLSSDPSMNWIFSELDPFEIVSNSDAHSLENFAREGNIIFSKFGFENFGFFDLQKVFKWRKYFYFYSEINPLERKYLDKLFLRENLLLLKEILYEKTNGKADFFAIKLKKIFDGNFELNLEEIKLDREFMEFYTDFLSKNVGDISKIFLKNKNLIKENLSFYISDTIEFYPQEGKYYGDGHSMCEYLVTPAEAIQNNYICPKCGKKITVGVFHRCFDLSDENRKKEISFGEKYYYLPSEIEEYSKKFFRSGYKYIVPLWDIIYEVWGKRKGTKGAWKIYNQIINNFGPEFYVLLEVPIEELKSFSEKFAQAIWKMRNSQIYVKPGYDGEFGIVKIFDIEEFKKKNLWEKKVLDKKNLDKLDNKKGIQKSLFEK